VISRDFRLRLFLFMAFVLSVVLAMQALDRLQGQWHYLALQELKAGWHERSRIPRDHELNEGFKLGYRALEREPTSAQYRLTLASMHAWRESTLRLWPEQAAAETGMTIQNLKAALARRPSWFEAWALLGLVKFQADEVDLQLKAALEKSIETGPFETSVQHGISFVGPRIRDQLSPQLLELVVRTMRAALDNPSVRGFVVEQIVMSGLESEFADRLEADEELVELSNKYRDKRKEAL
jgi:hypothetical protein